MRLFVAVDVGREVRERIAGLITLMKRALMQNGTRFDEGARFVRPESAHLTLAFLGEVRPDRIESLASSLADATVSESFRATFAGVGAFPDPCRARVMWSGAAEGAEDLRSLAGAVRRSLRAERSIEVDDREYVPHLTVCRFRRPRDLTKLAIFPGLQETEMGTCQIDRFLLMRSCLRPEGSVYEKLREFSLGEGRS